MAGDGNSDNLPVIPVPADFEKWEPEPWTQLGRGIVVDDPLLVPYGWVTAEVSEALGTMVQGDTRKRRTTILMMADAVASGNREVQEVLADTRTVGHACWYQRIRKDPHYDDAWRIVLDTAKAWYDRLEARRMVRRAMKTEQTRDEMVSLAGNAVRVLADLLDDPQVGSAVKERVAFGLLDRASEETAVKSSTAVTVKRGGDELSMRDIRAKRRRRNQDQAEAENPPAATVVVGSVEAAEEEPAELVEGEAQGEGLGD